MNRRNWLWFATIVALVLLVSLSSPAFLAQQPIAEGTDEVAEDSKGEEAVEKILRQQEALITGQGFSYNPEGRRDPFRPLFQSDPTLEQGQRPPGLAGMLIAELDLAGVINDPRDGDLAVVIGSDNKGYFLRVGDKVYDGTVIAIDTRLGTVTFRQDIDDPRNIKPYRDITKRLVPLDDEESGDE